MRIYLLPGLGADKRLFSRLRLENHSLIPLSWIRPQAEDTLEQYARKLAEQIPDPSESILLGVSLGGMVAIEAAKKIKPVKTVLISSAKTAGELPVYFRWIGKAGLDRSIRARHLIRLRLLAAPVFGRLGKGYSLFTEMLRETDPFFFDWAVRAVLNWHNTTVPRNVFHIHGTMDMVIPARNIHHFIPVKGGSHMMILNDPQKISLLIRKIIEV